MYHSFLIPLSTDGNISCFHVLAIVNSEVMKIGVHISLSILVSLVCMPNSGIAGLYSSAENVLFLILCLELSDNLNRNIKHHKEACLKLYLTKHTLLCFRLYLVLILHNRIFVNFLAPILLYNILNTIRDYDINIALLFLSQVH